MNAFLIQVQPQGFATEAYRVEIRGHLMPGDTLDFADWPHKLRVVQELPVLEESLVGPRGAGLKRFYCQPIANN